MGLFLDMRKFVECQGSESQPTGFSPCETSAFATFHLGWEAYEQIMILLGLVMSGPLARFMDVMGPGKRGLVMAASGTFMALGELWLYMCSKSSCLKYNVLLLTTANE